MGCKKRSMFSRCMHFLLGSVLFISAAFVSVPQKTEAAAFSYSGTELSGGMKSIFHPSSGYYKRTSQGFCVAGDYIIYTRWSNNSTATTYVVINAKTHKEVSHCECKTLHSNSLTYNPNTKEVVSVALGKAYVFSFQNHTLTYKKTVSLSKMICRISYVKSEGAYYMATGTHMYKSTNLSNMSELYSLSALAVNQGMGYDGKYLYICYSGSSKNYIKRITTGGKAIDVLTISNSLELEEVDFYHGNMIINVINSASKCGLYEVVGKNGTSTTGSSKSTGAKKKTSKKTDKKDSSKKDSSKDSSSSSEQKDTNVHEHEYGEWTVTKEATCGEAGEKERTCATCGDVETKEIPATGDHDYGEWETVIEETCGDKGQKQRTCENCGYVEVKDIPATGDHTLGDWEVTREATCTEDGTKIIQCLVCGQTIEKEKIPALGHAYTGWTTTKEATVLEEGEEERTCVNCGDVKTQTTEKLEPTIEISTDNMTLQTGESSDPIEVELSEGDQVTSWTSADESVATVSEDGEITAVGKGETTVTVTSEAGATADVAVEVQYLPVTTESVDVQASKGLIGDQLDMLEGESLSVDVSVQPATARSKAHYYSLSSVIASVDEDGLVTANAEGTTKIIIRVGWKFSTIDVTVHKNTNK